MGNLLHKFEEGKVKIMVSNNVETIADIKKEISLVPNGSKKRFCLKQSEKEISIGEYSFKPFQLFEIIEL